MKAFLTDIFTYQNHMNQEMGEALKRIEEPPEDLLDIYVHMIKAHQLWLERIEGDARTNPHEPMALDAAILQDNQNLSSTIALLDTIDLDQSLPYRNTKGDKFGNTVQEILYHISNHSTHHRAQLALRLRQAGMPPPVTDYIFYKRTSS